MEKKYYKVLMNGRSFHGGNMGWSLPNGKKPGEWHKIGGTLSICSRGLHLTCEPAKWFAVGAEIYEAEYRGDAQAEGDKIAVAECRLIRKLTNAEAETLNVFVSGEHDVAAGYGHASGSATVQAYGSATVRAYESATVQASGSATVQASGSATVQAYESATVQAYESATVTTVYGSPKVDLKDNNAVYIDRRNGKPVVQVGPGAKPAK